VGSSQQIFPSAGSCQSCPVIGLYGDVAMAGIPNYTLAMNSTRVHCALSRFEMGQGP